MFHLSLNSLILVGVVAQLLGGLAKHVFTKPAQQAQIDRIEAKVSDALTVVSSLTNSTPTAAPAAAGKDTAS